MGALAFEFDFDGETYQGTYTVEHDVLTVDTPFGPRSTSVGDTPPETLARIVAGEIASEASGQGGSEPRGPGRVHQR